MMSSDKNKLLRRIIMSEVEGCAISDVEIHEMTSEFFKPIEGEVISRIKRLPVYIENGLVTHTYRFSNNTKKPINLKTRNMETDLIKIYYNNITLLTLEPGERLSFTVTIDYGMPKHNVFYRTVETVILHEDNSLEIIPLKPFTKDWILDEAERILNAYSSH